MAASAATFALVTLGLWAELDGEGFWRATGTVAIVAIDGAHACFVLARRRADDPESVQLATTAAVVAAGISATLGVLAATGLADDGPWEPLAIVLVIQLLASALSPLLRRMARDQPMPSAADTPRDMAGELHVIADALDKAASPMAVRELADQLRRLARRA
jgi:4-amino-4-deoxy-L-arabinose transferase-like glycosyltransferase